MNHRNLFLLAAFLLSIPGCASQQTTDTAIPETAPKNNVAVTPPPTSGSPAPSTSSKAEDPKKSENAKKSVDPKKSDDGEDLKKRIVGKWRTTFPTASGDTGTITVTYTADGKQSQHAEGDGKVMDILATYTISNGELTQTFVSAIVEGKSMDPPEEKSRTFHIKIEGDKLSINMPGEASGQTFTRVKE